MENDVNKSRLPIPLWANPTIVLMVFVLPVLILSSIPFLLDNNEIELVMAFVFKQKVNNVNYYYIMVGVANILAMAIGSHVFSYSAERGTTDYHLNYRFINKYLFTVGAISLTCNMIFFTNVFLNYQVILAVFSGSRNAMMAGKSEILQIPGITSFISVCLPFFSLYSYLYIKNKKVISKVNTALCIILFAFVFLRSFLNTERIALIEGVVALFVPFAVFKLNSRRVRILIPVLSIPIMMIIFSLAEYFRSWPYYKELYNNNFPIFIAIRIFGYYSTAINNGCGLISHLGINYFPSLTYAWVYGTFGVFGIRSAKLDAATHYLQVYASQEFNSYGGVYIPYLDYGLLGGIVFCLVTGLFTGWLYRQFSRENFFAILLYPTWFVALLDVLRNWSFGGVRYFPVVFCAIVSYFFLYQYGYVRPAAKQTSLAP